MPIKRPGDGAKVMVFPYSFIVIILCVVIGPCAWLLIAVAILLFLLLFLLHSLGFLFLLVVDL